MIAPGKSEQGPCSSREERIEWIRAISARPYMRAGEIRRGSSVPCRRRNRRAPQPHSPECGQALALVGAGRRRPSPLLLAVFAHTDARSFRSGRWWQLNRGADAPDSAVRPRHCAVRPAGKLPDLPCGGADPALSLAGPDRGSPAGGRAGLAAGAAPSRCTGPIMVACVAQPRTAIPPGLNRQNQARRVRALSCDHAALIRAVAAKPPGASINAYPIPFGRGDGRADPCRC